jgi:osmotically inducible protein OsmC
MKIKSAKAEWFGDFRTGEGTITSGDFEAGYNFASVVGEAPGTSPTQVLGAALAGCYSGALTAALAKDKYSPKHVLTNADVHLEPNGAGFKVARIHLDAVAEVPDIEEAVFQEYAERVKKTCPVSEALAAIEITLDARLV